jgi:hypothetical protein
MKQRSQLACVSLLCVLSCARPAPTPAARDRERENERDDAGAVPRRNETAMSPVIKVQTCDSDECGCKPDAERDCYDGDQEHAGVGICKRGTQRCMTTTTVEFQTTIWGPCEGQVYAAAEDECNDELDNDCDDAVDEACPCKTGDTEPCDSACGDGLRTCRNGRYGACETSAPPQESCNGQDDDCDGVIDEVSKACSTQCGDGKQRCEDGRWSECSARGPEPETCNAEDDDCDGTVDGMSRSCEAACASGSQTCRAGEWSRCEGGPAPAAETCNLADDDCDGRSDEGLLAAWTFENRCSVSSIFVALGGCNVCSTTSTCSGTWLAAGESGQTEVAQQACFEISAFVRTPAGDLCLDADSTGRYVGEVREFCNGDCLPQPPISMNVPGGGC